MNKMRAVVGQFQVFDDGMGAFAAQIGVDEVQMNTPFLPGEKVWDIKDLKDLKHRIAAKGLKFEMIENIPLIFYDKVILGLPGRDEQIENYITTIKNCREIGIKILGHHFSPTFVWRTNTESLGRGGAFVTEYDDSKLAIDANALHRIMKHKRHKVDYNVFELAEGLTVDMLFANYEYFMKSVIPVAEECNVKLALHPDDPPVRNFGSIQRMITSQEDYIRAMEIADSPMWGVNLCLGCCSEMGGAETVKKMIRYFGPKKKIFCIHLRDVQGCLPYFKECFLGEGNFNPAEILYELSKTGYDGIILEDHVAKMTNDTAYGHTARAHEIGYIQGMMKMLEFINNDKE
jgi:mannonate dehydratase